MFLHTSRKQLAKCTAEWKLFQTKVVDKIETHILCWLYIIRDQTQQNYYIRHASLKWSCRTRKQWRIIEHSWCLEYFLDWEVKDFSCLHNLFYLQPLADVFHSLIGTVLIMHAKYCITWPFFTDSLQTLKWRNIFLQSVGIYLQDQTMWTLTNVTATSGSALDKKIV